MAIQTSTYETRLIEKSGLSPQALLVALVISKLRYQKRCHSHEPLALTIAEIADACHMGSRTTAHKWLQECITAGWIVSKSIHRNGKQQANEYWLSDPTDTATHPLPSPNPRTGTESNMVTESVMGLDTVLRSKNNGSATTPRPKAAGSATNKKTKTKTAPSVPAQPQAAEPSGAANPGAAVTHSDGLRNAISQSPPRRPLLMPATADTSLMAKSCAYCGSRAKPTRPPTAATWECSACSMPWHRHRLKAVAS